MSEKLLGDLTEQTLKKMGADKLVKFYERISGRPCNCANRKQTLNNLHKAAQRGLQRIQNLNQPSPEHKRPTKPADEQ